ncbi:MAG: hypothetical protein JO025_27305 [Verrucomicrobia bacterium]|nr:hypothetical protein [Verrucomicrobiota bacterium]
MRSWLFVCGSTILFAVTGHTQVTAYSALRTVGSSRGEKVLSQVLAISGEGAGAQPNRWKVLIDDPAARGGVRELEVSGNQITAERTPVKSEWAGGKDMDLAHLNLDSDGAYQVATQEARTKGLEFSKVQFQLAADRETGKPGWTVQMADAKDQRVGAIKLNADSGTIVSSAWGADAPNLVAQQRTSENSDERFLNSSESQTPVRHSQVEEAAPVAKATPEKQTPRYTQDQQQYADEPGQYGQSNQSNQSGQQSGSLTDRAGNIGRNVVNRVERPFLRAGGWIQKKFTGQDTISPPRTKDDDDDDDDNRSNDQYNKPVHPVPQ